MTHGSNKPIAVCSANEVECWDYPFYFRAAGDFEPAFLFLEEHYLNFSQSEIETLGGLVRVECEDDLTRLGLSKDAEGVYRV